MTLGNAPRLPEPRAREVEPRRDADSDDKSVDDPDAQSDFSNDLKDAKDQPDNTRAAQEMLAAGTLVKPSPVRVATFVPPTKPAASSPLEAAVNSLLDQLHAITQRIGVISQQALTAQTQSQVASITASISVEDLDDQSDEKKSETATPDGAFKLDGHMRLEAPAQAPKGPVATTAVREPAPLPDAPTSHMHLVVGEGDQRMVVTVAVRGEQVTATVRGGDEQLQAALARNAASLDHAMHTKGLDLSSFTAERDSADHHQNQHEAQERPSDEGTQEQFRLEEILK